jgi:dipeptidyl aminopeptidase/acylaminoacyl peptidase
MNELRRAFRPLVILVPAITITLLQGVACRASQPAAGNGAAAKATTEADVPLIPRRLIFGNPERTGPVLSDDGRQIAFRAPVNGVMNVWVAPVDKLDAARAVTDDTTRGIQQFFWASTSNHIIYLKDKGGDENWRVYAVDLSSGETKDLTPFDKVAAQIQGVSDKFPTDILVALNDRKPEFHDVHRINIVTGKRTPVQRNDAGFAGFLTDDDYNVRLAARQRPDGGIDLLQRAADGSFKPFETIGPDDSLTTSPAGFDSSGQTLYMIDSRGRDTAVVVSRNMATGASAVLAQDARVDAENALTHPKTGLLQAVSFNYDRVRWQVVDQAIAPDLEYLTSVTDGEMSVMSRTQDDSRWTVAYVKDDGPVRFYLYDRPKKTATFLYTNRPMLESAKLASMHAREITSRDGLTLMSYLTLPVWTDPDGDGVPAAPLPTILYVHGGPWGRDTWGYNATHQLFANRGYAVLSVNFRASTGFGKKFLNAGNREWAGKMHDDLIDAVNWAVAAKVADVKQVAIMGGSYGGYATLAGLTFTPDVFAAGVDIVGPSNLVTLLKTIPPYWAPQIELFTTRVGDHRTPEGRKFLESRSPLTFVDRISRPLLIAQGANDPRVKQAESDQIVSAMKAKNIPVVYALFPDEGHGFAKPENNVAFMAIAEAFFAQHLKGRAEPIGDAFKGSSVTIPHGKELVPGVADASGTD